MQEIVIARKNGDTGNRAVDLRWRDKKLLSAAVLPVLPKMFRHDSGVFTPSDLNGATIVKFGEIKKTRDDDFDCLLGIEYIPKGESGSTLLVLGFDDQGMWIEFERATA